jgi:glycosyltransferase involved in cell wall biosynthesis
VRFLFVHQNFPGQYRHLAPALAGRGHEVAGLGEAHNVARQRGLVPGVKLFGYRMPKSADADPGPLLRHFRDQLRRGAVAARAAAQLRSRGFIPDLVCAHIGWGEAVFLKDVFPEARLLLYCEYFYQPRGGDFGFDPHIRPAPGALQRLRAMNAPLLMAMSVCDGGVTATEWQRSRFPEFFRDRISVIHEGIDTERVRPDPQARFAVPGTDVVLTRRDQVVTYTARNLEPYRGFHIFMRAVPEILARCPEARVVIVGNDEVSYSPRLPQGQTYKLRALQEVGSRLDPKRVFFLPGLPYEQYLSLLQVSSAHVYLTYPFVLSWSMLEAMAAGGVVIGSNTAPVAEVIRDGENGLLADFFDPKAIAGRVGDVLAEPRRYEALRTRARADVIARYDLRTRCLERHVALAEELGRGGVPPRAGS